MSTIPVINIDHFRGHSNLNEGQRRGGDAILSEFLAAAKTDIIVVETEAGVNTSAVAALQSGSGFPVLTAFRVTGGTLSADGSEDGTVLGTDLLQSQTFAHYVLGVSLDIIAESPGTPGNALSVEVIDSAGVGGLAVSYAAGKLTIDLDGATPTEDQIATAVNTSGAWTGIFRANSGGGAAFGTVAEVPLAGGTGSGLAVYVGGGACTPVGETGAAATSTASYTDTSLAVNVPDLTGLTPALQATTDSAAVWLVSNGLRSHSVSVVLA